MEKKTWSRKAKDRQVDLAELRLLVRYWPATGRWTRCPGKRNGRAGLWADHIVSLGGYREVAVMCQRFLSHRLAWLFMTGEWPPLDMVVDHINGDPSDNRWSNLRLATPAQNIRNKKIQCNNTTGFKGVSLTATGKYLAQIKAEIDGVVKQKWLGEFASPEDAWAAYCEAAKKYHGEFARTA